MRITAAPARPASTARGVQGPTGLRPSRPFAAATASTDSGVAAVAGHEFGRIDVRNGAGLAQRTWAQVPIAGGVGTPLQRADKDEKKEKKKTVVEPGTQHHDRSKSKRLQKGLGAQQNLASKLQLAMLQDPTNQLSKKDLKRIANARAKAIKNSTKK